MSFLDDMQPEELEEYNRLMTRSIERLILLDESKSRKNAENEYKDMVKEFLERGYPLLQAIKRTAEQIAHMSTQVFDEERWPEKEETAEVSSYESIPWREREAKINRIARILVGDDLTEVEDEYIALIHGLNSFVEMLEKSEKSMVRVVNQAEKRVFDEDVEIEELRNVLSQTQVLVEQALSYVNRYKHEYGV